MSVVLRSWCERVGIPVVEALLGQINLSDYPSRAVQTTWQTDREVSKAWVMGQLDGFLGKRSDFERVYTLSLTCQRLHASDWSRVSLPIMQRPIQNMKTTLKLIVSTTLYFAFAVLGLCQTWDIASGYSGVSNPNGVWSYGRKWSVQATAMDLLTIKWGTDGWYMAGTGGSPSIMHLNWSTSLAGPFMWNADNSHGYCTDRWTCPTSGRYSIEGEFYAADGRGMDSYVYVVINGSIMFSNRIQSTTQSAPFSNSGVNLSQGDIVDFVIVWGGTGSPGTSSVTGVGGAITRVFTPATATATANVVNGYVVGVTMADTGYGYTNNPSVRFIGGGGGGAQVVAVASNGLILGVNILNPGSSFTNAPVVVIAPPFIPSPTMSISAMSRLGFTNLKEGTDYQLQSVVGGQFSDLGSPFTATNSTFERLFSGTVSTNGCRLVATPVPVQARATAQVVGGFVVGATLTSGGSGYVVDVPIVTILNNGAGSNATAVASISNGTVTEIAITSPGFGYIKGATIVIAPPPATEVWPQSASPVAKLDLSNLSAYDNYQLLFTPNLGGSWSNHGNLFTPTSAKMTQYHDAAGNIGFFRTLYMP